VSLDCVIYCAFYSILFRCRLFPDLVYNASSSKVRPSYYIAHDYVCWYCRVTLRVLIQEQGIVLVCWTAQPLSLPTMQSKLIVFIIIDFNQLCCNQAFCCSLLQVVFSINCLGTSLHALGSRMVLCQTFDRKVVVWISSAATVYQRQLSMPSLRGRLMSTSEIWAVNGHTTRCTAP